MMTYVQRINHFVLGLVDKLKLLEKLGSEFRIFPRKPSIKYSKTTKNVLRYEEPKVTNFWKMLKIDIDVI